MPTKKPTSEELATRANTRHPSDEDRAALREDLSAHPPTTWRAGIVNIAELSAINALGNGVLEETTRAAAKKLRRELNAESASTLELLAVDHVVLCWITYHHIDFLYTTKTRDSMPLAIADFWDRHLASAHRRYLRALESLARLRRLRLPSVQVNITASQTNITT